MALRLAALGIVLGGTVFWLFGGPNLGWTRTQEPVPRKDPVTEIEYVEWQKNFIPGVDFLGASLLAGAAAYGLSFLARPAKPHTDSQGPR